LGYLLAQQLVKAGTAGVKLFPAGEVTSKNSPT
jgi:hypothetical protein